jgi:hypothetical protein
MIVADYKALHFWPEATKERLTITWYSDLLIASPAIWDIAISLINTPRPGDYVVKSDVSFEEIGTHLSIQILHIVPMPMVSWDRAMSNYIRTKQKSEDFWYLKQLKNMKNEMPKIFKNNGKQNNYETLIVP